MKKNSGMPKKEGWYLVQLTTGTMGEDRPYDVDQCKMSDDPENPGMKWDVWGRHHVVAWAELPDPQIHTECYCETAEIGDWPCKYCMDNK